MGLDLEYTDGQTPIDEEEKEGLVITTITTRRELDEFEQLGVENATAWTMRRKPGVDQILTEEYVRELHRMMFADVWRWAGEFRTSNKNLGVDKSQIRVALRNLLDDCKYWINNKSFNTDEIAVRFSHRIVSVHPFPNGNGRHSRLIADVLISSGLGGTPFTWGRISLTAKGEARSKYLQALKRADEHNYDMLIKFARE